MIAFDPFTDAAITDPYPQYATLRARDPVHRSEKLRAWVLFRYDDVAAVLRDDRRFSADRLRGRRGEPGDGGWPSGLRTLTADPPACLAPRAILAGALGPRVRAIAPRLGAIVHELLEAMASRPEPDLVADFAHPLPIRVIAELVGIPEGDRPRFQALSATIARGMDRFYGADDVAAGLREIGAYFVGLVAERRATEGDDLVHALLRAEHQGERLSDLEVTALCTALVFGGHETTVTLVSRGLLALLRHPRELARLRSDAALVPTAVEELLRYETPPQFVSRTVREACTLRGSSLRAGDTVLVGIGPANRDPAVFADPERLDVARTPNPHLAFGLATHVCPGAQLARLEARAAIPALLARFPRLRLAGEPVWRRTIILRALERLPVGLD
jgi:pimeloyl-[acyl-carrier protein] synthase